MNDYINKWFWIKNIDGICDSKIREKYVSHSRGVFPCVEESGNILTLRDYEEPDAIRVLNNSVEERPAPQFLHDDFVLVIKKNIKAKVKHHCWHFNDKYYYYFLVDENGKELKKRYMADELQKLEDV